jgi:4-diphosphocytidyl-2-C-methyl-D-erythritol kinase
VSAVVARAPAKVNVHLAVGPLRPDGFHELRTVYLAISLFDTVSVRPGDGLALAVTGEGTGAARGADLVPTDRRNLVWQAAELLAASAGVTPDATIEITKSIPAAAGLAGGSADAAAALVALDALWGTRAGREDLLALAARLGSDVPFSLLGGVALGTGRGEQLTPVLSRTRWHWVLGIAGEGLSTPAVYGQLDRLRAAGRVPDGQELAAAQPVVAGGLRVAIEAGAAAVLVSGSGPTVAALVEDEQDAVRIAAELAGAGVFRTVRAVYGPVPGARLVG